MKARALKIVTFGEDSGSYSIEALKRTYYLQHAYLIPIKRFPQRQLILKHLFLLQLF